LFQSSVLSENAENSRNVKLKEFKGEQP